MSGETSSTKKFKCPPNFKEVTIEVQDELCIEDVQNENNELWLIQAPCEMDLSVLENKNVSLNEKTVFNDLKDGTCQEITTFKNIPENFLKYQLLLPKRSDNKLHLVSKHFSGYMCLEETLYPIPSECILKDTVRSIATYDNLRQRYMAYGSGDPVSVSDTNNKSKSKKKKKDKEHASYKNTSEDCSTSKNNSRLSLLEERYNYFPIYEGDSKLEGEKSIKKSHKKKKINNPDETSLSSNNLIISPQEKLSSDSDGICWHPEDKKENRKSKDKRKKRKNADLYDNELEINVESITLDSTIPENTTMYENQNNFVSQEFQITEHKNKKHEKNIETNEFVKQESSINGEDFQKSELSSCILDENHISDEQIKSRKKHKKKKIKDLKCEFTSPTYIKPENETKYSMSIKSENNSIEFSNLNTTDCIKQEIKSDQNKYSPVKKHKKLKREFCKNENSTGDQLSSPSTSSAYIKQEILTDDDYIPAKMPKLENSDTTETIIYDTIEMGKISKKHKRSKI